MLGDEVGPLEVGVHDHVPGVFRELVDVDLYALKDAREVEQHVDPAKPRLGGDHPAGHGGFVRNVHVPVAGIAAGLVDVGHGRTSGGVVNVEHGHHCPVGPDPERSRPPYAGGPSGDDDAFAL